LLRQTAPLKRAQIAPGHYFCKALPHRFPPAREML
jgi:hypothetical protein